LAFAEEIKMVSKICVQRVAINCLIAFLFVVSSEKNKLNYCISFILLSRCILQI